MSTVPKLLYRFNTIQIKISAGEMEKLILKHIWNPERCEESKQYCKRTKVEDAHFLTSKVTTKLW